MNDKAAGKSDRHVYRSPWADAQGVQWVVEPIDPEQETCRCDRPIDCGDGICLQCDYPIAAPSNA